MITARSSQNAKTSHQSKKNTWNVADRSIEEEPALAGLLLRTCQCPKKFGNVETDGIQHSTRLTVGTHANQQVVQRLFGGNRRHANGNDDR